MKYLFPNTTLYNLSLKMIMTHQHVKYNNFELTPQCLSHMTQLLHFFLDSSLYNFSLYVFIIFLES